MFLQVGYFSPSVNNGTKAFDVGPSSEWYEAWWMYAIRVVFTILFPCCGAFGKSNMSLLSSCQMFSGSLQLALVTGIAATVMPKRRYTDHSKRTYSIELVQTGESLILTIKWTNKMAIVIYFIVPSLLLPYLHIHIVYTVCKSHRKVRNSIAEQHRNADFSNQIKLSVMLLFVYLGYLLAFLPYFGVFIADLAGVTAHYFAYQMAAYIMNAQSMINVLIYGIMNI